MIRSHGVSYSTGIHKSATAASSRARKRRFCTNCRSDLAMNRIASTPDRTHRLDDGAVCAAGSTLTEKRLGMQRGMKMVADVHMQWHGMYSGTHTMARLTGKLTEAAVHV
jgi:hypothetical protein